MSGNDGIQTIGGITYTVTKKGGTLKATKDKDGFIKLVGHDVKVTLPENSASKIKVFSSTNMRIDDGDENNGKKYADQIVIDKDSKYVTYDAAKKNTPADNSIDGDIIKINDAQNTFVNARSGNNVFILSSASNTRVDMYPGTNVQDTGQNSKVINEKVKESISKDLASGILTQKTKFRLIGDNEEVVVFDSEKYQKENNGKKLTFGEIKERYGIPAGELKKYNDLQFGTYQQTKGRGDDTDQYYPEELMGSGEVTIPKSAIKKYLDELKK